MSATPYDRLRAICVRLSELLDSGRKMSHADQAELESSAVEYGATIRRQRLVYQPKERQP